MTITAQQKHTIEQIISIFETGRLTSPSAYATCTILKDGAGISYGKHQSTDRSDSLDQIVFRYIDAHGQYANQMLPYVDLLKTDATASVDPNHIPANVAAFMAILKQAGADPIMQQAQDAVFDVGYWDPAVSQGTSMGLVLPLSYAILYDTAIHSGPGGIANIRKQFAESPPARGGDEKKWALAYIHARRAWLASSSNPLVQKTVYRMDALKAIADTGNWDLNLPLTVRGITIS